MLSFFLLCVCSKDCQEPKESSCSVKAVTLDTFKKEAAPQSSEEHQAESAVTATIWRSRDLLIKGVAE